MFVMNNDGFKHFLQKKNPLEYHCETKFCHIQKRNLQSTAEFLATAREVDLL